MQFAERLAPGATRLGIRGTVTTTAGYAFFQRFPDRRINEADLAARIPKLTTFIAECRENYNLAKPPLVIGFSNGAIMSTAMLMSDPGLFAGAILFRPLRPFATAPSTHLGGIPVLIIDGMHDTRRSFGDGALLAEQLQALGGVISHHVLPTGHSLTNEDCQIARDWIETFGLR